MYYCRLQTAYGEIDKFSGSKNGADPLGSYLPWPAFGHAPHRAKPFSILVGRIANTNSWFSIIPGNKSHFLPFQLVLFTIRILARWGAWPVSWPGGTEYSGT